MCVMIFFKYQIPKLVKKSKHLPAMIKPCYYQPHTHTKKKKKKKKGNYLAKSGAINFHQAQDSKTRQEATH